MLKAWRSSVGLSQMQAAELVGVRQPTLCAWERGKASPHVDGALRIERASEGAVPVESWATPGVLTGIDAALAARAAQPTAA